MKRTIFVIISVLTLNMISAITMALTADELNTEALEFISKEKQEDEDYVAALGKLDGLTQQYPDYFIGWYNKANIYMHLGQKEYAIQSIKKVVELEPHFGDAWYLYGQILSSDGLAIECFDKAITSTYYAMGKSYLNLAWFNKGIAIYKYYKDDKKQYDEVIRCIDNALGGSQSIPDVMLTTKAFILFEMGRYVDAITTAESAIQWFKDTERSLDKTLLPFNQGGLYNVIGLCHYKLGNAKEALDAYIEAINLLGQASEPLANLLLAGVWGNVGILYHIAHQYSDAIKCYDIAGITLSVGDEHKYIRANNGYALFCQAIKEESKGNIEEAKQHYQRAFETGSLEGFSHGALDYYYTDEQIWLCRLGYQELSRRSLIRGIEEYQGIGYLIPNSETIYATNAPVVNWCEKIEEFELTELDPISLEGEKGLVRLAESVVDPGIVRTFLEEYRSAKDWALIIGIKEYNLEKNGFEELKYARQDAEKMHDFVIKEMGFLPDNVHILCDEQATKVNIETDIDWLVENTESNDRVIIFFSGHGYNHKVREDSFSYLIPTDGIKDHVSSTCMSMNVLKHKILVMPAKHILAIFDSCYSGGIGIKGSPGRERDNWNIIWKLSKEPGRHAITAGRDNEIAVEKEGLGVFTRYLIEGLRGAADTDQNKVITLSELHTYVQNSVIRDSDSNQTPQIFSLSNYRGEYVFIYPKSFE